MPDAAEISRMLHQDDPQGALARPHTLVFTFERYPGIEAFGRGVCARQIMDWCLNAGLRDGQDTDSRTFAIGDHAGWAFSFADAAARRRCHSAFAAFL